MTAFIRPEGYLVTRFIEGSPVSDEAVHRPETLRRVADSLRRIHDGPAIPGLFVPLRIVEAYRALAIARGVPIPPEYELAAAIGRRIELACLAAPIELRPCHNDLLNANFIDDGTRIRIVDWEYAGMGDPFFDLGNFSINHELTPDEDEILLAAYDGDGPARPRLARLTLMRVVSDFREAMWGVLQQGISTLDVDFVAYAGEHFDRLLANAGDAGASSRPSTRSRRTERRRAADRRHRARGSVAVRRARVGDLARRRDERPVVGIGLQRQLEDARRSRRRAARCSRRCGRSRAARRRRCRRRTRGSRGPGPRGRTDPGARTARSRGRGR